MWQPLKMPTTRFAPSPTGLLHLGHAYSAWQSREWAEGGDFLIRIEDLDSERCRAEFEEWLIQDLAWLGIESSKPPLRQSSRYEAYSQAIETLNEKGLLYPCFCSRKEINEEIRRIGSAPHGPEGILYPGTCRGLDPDEAKERINTGLPHTLRLNAEKAAELSGPLTFTDLDQGTFETDPTLFGDPILARREGGYSYHLAVVVDDAWQQVDLVTRGRDLLPACHLHRLIQYHLHLPEPCYRHHRLAVDAEGKRLAKHVNSLAIRTLRDEGLTPDQVLAQAFKSLEPLA